MELARARKARTAPRHGGKVLADALVAQGIDHVFEVPGESFLDTLDGLYDTGGKIKLVTCRFEAGAVNMAEAFGKLTGRPAAAMVTRGPGACHGAIGVHVAYQDSTPMLLFVGQIPHMDTGRDAFQEVDYRQMFAPLAKWVTQIDHAARIPEVVAHAVDVATSGRPGPVVIALSEEMQKDQVQIPDLHRAKVSPAFPDPEALLQLRVLLGKAKKPIAVVGGSCWTPEGRTALHRFLTQNNIPVTVGFRRQAHYDGSLENFAGDLGVGSDPGLIGKLKEADLVLAIGCRLGDAVTQGLHPARHGRQPADRADPSRRRRNRSGVPHRLGHRVRPQTPSPSRLPAWIPSSQPGPDGPRNSARSERPSARCRTTRAS